MTLPNGTGHESPPDGAVGQDRDGNAEEEVNRQLVELDRIERAAPSRGRVQFSMLQGTDVEVSNRAPQQGATSLSSACAMEAIFEDEEGSPQKSPDLNSNGAAQPKPPQMETFEQSEQSPTDGRRTLASRKKMTAAEIEALEHSPAEQLDGDGEFCFSHTPLDQDDDDDDDEDKQTRRQSGSTRNILEAVKNQLEEQLIRQGIGKAASSEAVDLRNSRQEDSRSHRSLSRPTRAQVLVSRILQLWAPHMSDAGPVFRSRRAMGRYPLPPKTNSRLSRHRGRSGCFGILGGLRRCCLERAAMMRASAAEICQLARLSH
eukprot:822961-Rhodomonas_salina.2